MSWTWDSTEITHDQTCWTYDGHNGCDLGGGGSKSKQQPQGTWRDYQKKYDEPDINKKMILQEDRDIIDFIQTILTKGII